MTLLRTNNLAEVLKKWVQSAAPIPAAVTGMGAAAAYFLLLNQSEPITGIMAVGIVLYLWLVFSLLAHLLIRKVILQALQEFSLPWRIAWVAGSLAAGLWLTHNIPLDYPYPRYAPFVLSAPAKVIFLLGSGVGLGVLLLSAIAWLVSHQPADHQERPPRRFRWLLYALPMLIAWLVYLLAYYPGMMSADSLNQWEQVLSGQYNNHHPAFHTFTIWLATRVYLSPVVVAASQILALALTAGAILAYFESAGAPQVLLWLVSLGFALSPVNGTMVVTLWKDIPYSTSLLAFTFLVFLIARTGGKWLEHRGNWLLLGITAVLVTLFRHNGLPVVGIVFLLLLAAYLKIWRPLALAVVTFLGLYLFITGPLYAWAGVTAHDGLVDDSVSIYAMAAYADPGTGADKAFLSIQPFSEGRDCSLFDRLNELEKQEGLGKDETSIEAAVNLIRRSPGLLLFHYRCNRSLVWLISDPYGEVKNASHTDYLIDPNPFGLEHDSKLPVLRDRISRFVSRSSKPDGGNWLVWRPALYMYVFFGIIAAGALRAKDWRLLLPAAPLLLQAVASTLVLLFPNFRYHYAVYLIALLFLPVIFIPARQPAEAWAHQQVNENTEASRTPPETQAVS